MPVIARSIAGDGSRWLQVMLPGRPDGSTGWISEQDTRAMVTAWAIVVELAARRVNVYDDARLVRSFEAVVGKPSTPTPTGQFFVEETLQMSGRGARRPFRAGAQRPLQRAAGIRRRARAKSRFTDERTSEARSAAAASHGCVRLATASIDWLAGRIAPGTPVTIDAG